MARDISGISEVANLLQPGETIAYETRLGDKVFIRYWLTYKGRCSRFRRRFAYVQTVDQGLVGGRGIAKVAGQLETTPGFRPRLYTVRADQQVFELRLGPKRARARMPDGSRLATQSEDPDALLPSNAIPILAVALALRREALRAGEGIVLQCFVPDSMLPAQYRLSRRDGDWTSNFGERVTFGSDGFPETLEICDKQVLVRRLHDVPPPRLRPAGPTKAADRKPPLLGARDKPFSFAGPNGRVFGTIGFPPKNRDVRATVLFLGGSGIFDREGRTQEGFDIGYSRLFSIFADHGLATARYDKPGAGGTARGRLIDQHYDAVVETAVRAFIKLQERADLADMPKVIVGHSQGGLVALELAGRFNPASVGLLATAAMPLDRLIVDQVRRQLQKAKAPPRTRQATIKELEDFFDHVRRDVPWDVERIPGPLYLRSRSRMWYREILARDPLELVRNVRAPLVIAQGGQDIQVPPHDADALARAARGRNLPVRLLKFPDLDHFFRRVHAKDPAEAYYDRRRKLDRRAAAAIAEALLKTLPMA